MLGMHGCRKFRSTMMRLFATLSTKPAKRKDGMTESFFMPYAFPAYAVSNFVLIEPFNRR